MYGVFISLKKKGSYFFTDKTKTLNVCLRMEPDFEIGIPKASKSSSKSSSSQKKRKKEERNVEWSPSSFTARATKERWFFYRRVND